MNHMESYYPLGLVLRGEKNIYGGSLLCRGSQRLFLAPLRNVLTGNTVPRNTKFRCLIAGVIVCS